jgi:hypothetical protein
MGVKARRAYPIHSSAGGKPSGFLHNGESRKKRRNSDVYLTDIAGELDRDAHLSVRIAGRQSAQSYGRCRADSALANQRRGGLVGNASIC